MLDNENDIEKSVCNKKKERISAKGTTRWSILNNWYHISHEENLLTDLLLNQLFRIIQSTMARFKVEDYA